MNRLRCWCRPLWRAVSYLSEFQPNLPRLGITTGDPAGVGPEISLRAAEEIELRKACRLVLFGSWNMLQSRAAMLGLPFDFTRISLDALLDGAPVPDCGIVDIPGEEEIRPGSGSRASGQAAARNIIECHAACVRGRLDAMVTAPLHKKHFQEAGYDFPGHTEFLANLCDVEETAMAFLTDSLKVVLATIHSPLRTVVETLSSELIYRKLCIILTEFPRLGLSCDRVAVAGLNPHAGEAGIMGSEEKDIIAPAIVMAREAFPRAAIDGPLPADTLFWRASKGEFDVILAMYHDQGLAPVKLMGFGRAVNVTLGLPYIRTSVDHGTAFEIAGKAIARHDSMNTAIRWAIRLVCSASGSTAEHQR
jgi:4-hydroxythreonine-4-phosphate dehydrogenase